MSGAVSTADHFVGGFSDVPVRWSHLLNKGALSKSRRPGGVPFPCEASLLKALVIPEDRPHEVLIETPGEAKTVEIREWLQTWASEQYSLFGRFSWTRNEFAIARKNEGLLIRFADRKLAAFFKMTFC